MMELPWADIYLSCLTPAHTLRPHPPRGTMANLKTFGRATFNLGNEAGDRARSLFLRALGSQTP